MNQEFDKRLTKMNRSLELYFQNRRRKAQRELAREKREYAYERNRIFRIVRSRFPDLDSLPELSLRKCDDKEFVRQINGEISSCLLPRTRRAEIYYKKHPTQKTIVF